MSSQMVWRGDLSDLTRLGAHQESAGDLVAQAG
jgi:hypothetical protein